MSQPFFVAEKFSGLKGQSIKLSDTVKSCKMILDGKLDDLPEQAFQYVGTAEEAIAKAKK